MAVDDGVGGKIIHAGETHFFDLAEPMPHPPARIGGVDAADNRDFFDDGEHLVFADLHGDGVGVAVGHHAGGGAVAHHAETAAVIDYNQIGSAFLDEFGADAGPGTGSDDGVTFGERGAEAFAHFLARVRVSFSGPGIGHER